MSDRGHSTDPLTYARRLLGVCNFYSTPEEWGSKNGRELRTVIAALVADREQPGVVLRFEDGQITGWYR